MGKEEKIVIWRLGAALVAGPILSVSFIALFSTLDRGASNLMFEFVAHVLGLGFEGAFATLVITASSIAAVFSIVCWLALRTWGPLRKQSKA